MHAVFDTAAIVRQKKVSAREQHEQQIRDWIKEQQNNVVVLGDMSLSPANSERQIGKAMFADHLEKGLRRLNTQLHFEINPFNTSKKALYHTPAGSKKEYICSYENGVMPEHSIMAVKDHEEPEADLLYKTRHIDRKDLPSHKVIDGEIVYENSTTPGFRKTQILWHEAIRGWRTVLIKLVQYRVATPAEVENLFGIDSRPEWASKMGKRTDLRTIL